MKVRNEFVTPIAIRKTARGNGGKLRAREIVIRDTLFGCRPGINPVIIPIIIPRIRKTIKLNILEKGILKLNMINFYYCIRYYLYLLCSKYYGDDFMFGGMNPRQMQKMMKQMGISQEEVAAEEVIIKQADKDLVISEPNVVKVMMGGQETFQIVGKISERAREAFSKEDVQMIMDQTGATSDEAASALKSEGDIAKAILKIKG
jgi:nascent polypeptide-associated complex subunit alpha